MAPLIEEGATVLFQGDSITDCKRDRESGDDLGRGYPMLIASRFSALWPELNVRFLNRGVGGNRVSNLLGRWQADAIDLKPDWISILIGINNTWRRYDRDDPTPLETFEGEYRELLERTRRETSARLILMEPFVLPVPDDRRAWREDLDPKIHVVREVAREFGARLIPMDGLFAEAASRRPPEFWAPDGVHPSPAGHALIADAWLRAVRAE